MIVLLFLNLSRTAAKTHATIPIDNQLISKPTPKPSPTPTPTPRPQVKKTGLGTNIRSDKVGDEGKIQAYLISVKSPLAPYSTLIAQSPYWSVIIGISAIEQQYCKIMPGGNNWNCWGIGGASRLAFYPTAEVGIGAINDFLVKAELTHKTVQSLNGWYVYPASTNWLNTVLKIKNTLESL